MHRQFVSNDVQAGAFLAAFETSTIVSSALDQPVENIATPALSESRGSALREVDSWHPKWTELGDATVPLETPDADEFHEALAAVFENPAWDM